LNTTISIDPMRINNAKSGKQLPNQGNSGKKGRKRNKPNKNKADLGVEKGGNAPIRNQARKNNKQKAVRSVTWSKLGNNTWLKTEKLENQDGSTKIRYVAGTNDVVKAGEVPQNALKLFNSTKLKEKIKFHITFFPDYFSDRKDLNKVKVYSVGMLMDKEHSYEHMPRKHYIVSNLVKRWSQTFSKEQSALNDMRLAVTSLDELKSISGDDLQGKFLVETLIYARDSVDDIVDREGLVNKNKKNKAAELSGSK